MVTKALTWTSLVRSLSYCTNQSYRLISQPHLFVSFELFAFLNILCLFQAIKMQAQHLGAEIWVFISSHFKQSLFNFIRLNILCVFQDLNMLEGIVRGMAIAPGKETGKHSISSDCLLLVCLQHIFLANQLGLVCFSVMIWYCIMCRLFKIIFK